MLHSLFPWHIPTSYPSSFISFLPFLSPSLHSPPLPLLLTHYFLPSPPPYSLPPSSPLPLSTPYPTGGRRLSFFRFRPTERIRYIKKNKRKREKGKRGAIKKEKKREREKKVITLTVFVTGRSNNLSLV